MLDRFLQSDKGLVTSIILVILGFWKVADILLWMVRHIRIV